MTSAVDGSPRDRARAVIELSPDDGAHVALRLDGASVTVASPLVRVVVDGVEVAHLRDARVSHDAGTDAAEGLLDGTGVRAHWAARRLGVEATVVCPETTSPAKLEALGRSEINLVLHGTSADEAEAHALALAASGMRYVSAYNDPDVIAGQGTLVAELGARDGAPFTIVTPVGGGGLAAGVGLAASGLGEARVVGVQGEASHAMRAALDAGRIVPVDERPSLADGLAGNLEPGSVTFELVRRHVDDVVLVTEDEIAAAIRFLASEQGLVVEGAGAAGVAALIAGRIGARAGRTVIVATGRNIAPALLARVLQDA